MIADDSFLTHAEQTDFDDPRHRVERQVIERYPNPDTTNVSLGSALVSTAQLHRRDSVENGYWFEAACIQVRPGDGMTWSAETARRAFAKAFPHFRIYNVSDELSPDSLPAIAKLTGEDVLLQVAVKTKLTRPFVGLGSRHGLMNFAIVIAVAALTQILMVLLKKTGDAESAFFSSSFYLTLMGYALLAAIAQWVLATHFFKRDDAIAHLLANLQDEKRERQHDAFAEALAYRLSRDASPRFVIVDGFGRLDELSQRVITAYFERHTATHTASEMWTIFENDDDVVFGAMVPRRKAIGGYASTRLYDQELLSAEERTLLAEKVGAPERATFATVKQIVSFTGGDVEWIDAWFREYVKRTGEPKRNALTYFYLLALEQPDLRPSQRQRPLGGHLVFAWPWLEKLSTGEASEETIHVQSLAAQKQTGLARIVAQFFGAPLRVREINEFSREIERDFDRFLVYRNERTQARFHVAREAAEWLVDHERELKLPPLSVGKLFWALALSNAKPNDSAWMRRALRNLLEVDLGAIPDDVRAELYPQVRNLFFRFIDASMRRSRFQDVPELLEAAVNMVVEFDSDKTPHLVALRNRAWDVYLISGSDAALRALLAIGESLGEMADDIQVGRLLRLFAQTCRLSPASRGALESQLASATGSQLEVAHDHAVAVALWVVVDGAPFFPTASSRPKARWIFDLTDVLDTIEGTIDRIAARVAASAETYVLDIATLSMCAWTLALLQRDDLPWLRKTGEGLLPLQEVQQRRLADVIAASEKVAIAAGLYVKTSRKPGTVNFLGEAMTYDACATAMAAAWYARSAERRYTRQDSLGASSKRVVQSVNEILQTDIDWSNDEAVLAETERLLDAAAMTWQRFGLERLAHIAAIRRVGFSFSVRNVSAADHATHGPLVKSMSGVLREADVVGLLANTTLAHCFNASAGMLSYYVTSAAELALTNDFAETLQTALALVAVFHPSSKMAERAEKLAARLLIDGGDGSVLQTFLDAVPDDEVMSWVMRLDYLRSVSTLADVQRGIENLFRLRSEHAQSEELRNEMLDLVAYGELKRKSSATLDPDEEMKQWAARRDKWIYPKVLRILFDAPTGPERVRDEAEKLLDRDPQSDPANSWYHLAIRLTKNLVANSLSTDVPVRYLRNAVTKWERVDEEVTLDTYRLLARLDISNAWQHRAQLARWQSIIIERDHLQLLPELARRGRFFLIFTDYVDHMWHWGLGIDVPDAEVFRRRNLPLHVRQATAAEWKKKGALVPRPLVPAPNGSLVVSGEFFLTGNLLFMPPVETDPDYDQDRLRFDEESRRNLSRLIDEVRRLEALPTTIRDLIARYANDYVA